MHVLIIRISLPHKKHHLFVRHSPASQKRTLICALVANLTNALFSLTFALPFLRFIALVKNILDNHYPNINLAMYNQIHIHFIKE
tara:strand:- start:12258 stop:12512 length:255 start_codon:yes stop_codon:yes gene_type:complete